MFNSLLCVSKQLIGVFSLIGVVALACALLFIIGKNQKNNTKVLAYGAICTALAFGLSYFKIRVGPNGGSITPASMVPILIFAYCFGIGKGLMVGLIYGILQFIQSPEFLSVPQFMFDYLLAFTALGLCGIFFKIKNTRTSILLGALTSCLIRLVCTVIAGFLWFYEYGAYPTIALFGSTEGMGAFIYSLLYNATYLIPETVIVLIVIALLTTSKNFLRALPIQSARRKAIIAEEIAVSNNNLDISTPVESAKKEQSVQSETQNAETNETVAEDSGNDEAN